MALCAIGDLEGRQRFCHSSVDVRIVKTVSRPVTGAPGLHDPGVRERITQAFLRLRYDHPEDRKLLDLHRTKGYVKAMDEDWKGIEEAAVSAGLLK